MNIEKYIEKNKKIILKDIDIAIDKIKKDKAYNLKYKEFSVLLKKFKKLYGNEVEDLIKKQAEVMKIIEAQQIVKKEMEEKESEREKDKEKEEQKKEDKEKTKDKPENKEGKEDREHDEPEGSNA